MYAGQPFGGKVDIRIWECITLSGFYFCFIFNIYSYVFKIYYILFFSFIFVQNMCYLLLYLFF